jgi:hypothetical protein
LAGLIARGLGDVKGPNGELGDEFLKDPAHDWIFHARTK